MKTYKFSELRGKLRVGDKIIYPRSSDKESYDVLWVGVDSFEYIRTLRGSFDLISTQKYRGDDTLEIIEHAPPTWETLKVGDRLQNDDLDTAIVLEVGLSGGTFLLSKWNDDGSYDAYEETYKWLTITEAKRTYTLLLDEEPTTPREVTMKDVYEKFGEEVKIIKE